MKPVRMKAGRSPGRKKEGSGINCRPSEGDSVPAMPQLKKQFLMAGNLIERM